MCTRFWLGTELFFWIGQSSFGVFAMGMTTSHCALLLVSVRLRLFPFCEVYLCSFELSATFYFYISGFEFQVPRKKKKEKKKELIHLLQVV